MYHRKENMKFTLYQMDYLSNVFLVIPKENNELPLIVHGILKVSGKGYRDSFCSINDISDELRLSGELEKLEEQAKIEYYR